MPFKFNISDKEGKSWKLEVEETAIVGKSVGDNVSGKDVSADLEGYEFEITGGSDSAGFPMSKDVEGIGLKRVLLTKGWGMHKRPKGLRKKKAPQPDGLRLRKTVRGKAISDATVQINLKVLKDGKKKLSEIFPDQNSVKPVEAPVEKPAEEEKEGKAEKKPVEKPAEAPKEDVKEEVKEEKKEEPKSE